MGTFIVLAARQPQRSHQARLYRQPNCSRAPGVYSRFAMTIDVWMQHPTQRFLRNEMLASLRRWTGGSIPDTEIPIEATIAAMDAADVDLGLLSAWRGPYRQDLISNDEVAAWIRLHPNRFVGLATVDLDRPMAAV